MARILIVDDEAQIRSMLRRFLINEGFTVAEAASGGAARAVLGDTPFDLVLLDLMLPDEDGLSLARHIRRQCDTPIIMLTGKGDVIDRVVGLESGADDYIAKPFHLREVLARIRTVMRRVSPPVPAAMAAAPLAAAFAGALAGAAPPAAEVLGFGPWRLDLTRRELRRGDGAPVTLTSGEFELLRAFLLHPNRVLNRDQLMDLVKGRDWSAFDRAIDTQVVRLRRKIEADPAKPRLIKTVRGAGYVFAAPVTRY